MVSDDDTVNPPVLAMSVFMVSTKSSSMPLTGTNLSFSAILQRHKQQENVTGEVSLRDQNYCTRHNPQHMHCGGYTLGIKKCHTVV